MFPSRFASRPLGCPLPRQGRLLLLALAAACPPAWAQAPLPRVEVTGSALRQIDGESTVPLTVLRADSLRRQGVSTLEQALARLAANQSATVLSSVIGGASGGASFADLRGLGADKTLVLLNGRRLANQAVDGGAVDLNMIPFALIDRIEVLRDGASALYGSEAIGGVINLITREDVGDTLELSIEQPQRSGGRSRELNASLGFGDLAGRGFSASLAGGLRQTTAIRSGQRRFGARGVIPERGVDYSSFYTGPANYSQTQGADTFFAHPLAPDCAAPGFSGDGTSCYFDTVRDTDLSPRSESQFLQAEARLRLPGAMTLKLEQLLSRHLVGQTLAGTPLASGDGFLPVAPGTAFYPGQGGVPAPDGFVLDPGLPVDAYWRAPGQRRIASDNRQGRWTAELAGALGAWELRQGLSLQLGRVSEQLRGGAYDEAALAAGVNSGLLNPFGAQTPAGLAGLREAEVGGEIQRARGRVLALDSQWRRDLAWPGLARPAGVALGGELRHEDYAIEVIDAVASRVPTQGLDPASDVQASRRAGALWAELQLPLAPTLELNLALRHDRVGQVGRQTSPKLALRWQASRDALLRASVGRGFRAPTLYELKQPGFATFSAAPFDDPLLCPGGVAVPGADAARVCGRQLVEQGGGRDDLQPERSEQASLGLVLQAGPRASLTADLWAVRIRDVIVAPTASAVLQNAAANAGLILRDPADGNVITAIDTRLFNASAIRSHGLDLGAQWQPALPLPGRLTLALQGTRVFSHTLRGGLAGEVEERVGRHGSRGPIFRWQHSLSASYAQGAWSATLAQRYRSGYRDENSALIDPAFHGRVGSTSVWDLGLGWSPQPGLELLALLRNAFDRDPPFSNQSSQFQTGYDARYTDATGRALGLRLVWTPR
ncbi:TonB-dependent receptor [Piscinibacter sp. Jin2]|uniref:TonB-dependent receptor n=1 Tax=Aquariibacter lacus TaxID=2801332 RepID=A0A9X1BQ76_9BURK|nr:TonB-dependent receptor [Piscinibacter lacus]MBL0719416.1 TonB-dependent receptor [Piscinibacter lacus]